MPYREIAAKRVTHISFLLLISFRNCFTFVNSNTLVEKVKLDILDVYVFNNVYINKKQGKPLNLKTLQLNCWNITQVILVCNMSTSFSRLTSYLIQSDLLKR